MKLFKRIILITILLIILLIEKSFARTGTVIVEASRIRKEANTTSDIVNVIYEDDEVEILEEKDNWYKIKFKNDVGYVKKEFIKEDSKKTDNVKNEITSTNTNSVENSTNNITNTNANTNTVQEEPKAPANVVDSNQITIAKATNLKYLPSFLSNDVTTIQIGKTFTKICEINNWIQVTDNSVTGWVLKSKTQIGGNAVSPEVNNNTSNIDNTKNTVNNAPVENTSVEKNVTPPKTETTSKKVGIINVETARVRAKASTTADIVDYLDSDEKVTITGEEDEWYAITFRNNKTGFINKTLVKVEEKEISSRSLTDGRNFEETDNTTISQESNTDLTNALTQPKGEDVANFAKQYLGYSYVSGGRTPESGFDCSGFTKYVFSNFGVSLGATAASQNTTGTEVARSNLAPGDLILFYDEGKNKIGHTGIYIGNGEFIHSANPERGVVIDNLNTNTYYNERFITSKRIVE